MTNDEKAQYYDQWKDYFEPLARVRREVRKSQKYFSYGFVADPDFFAVLIMGDAEVRPELENLIQTMLNEVGE